MEGKSDKVSEIDLGSLDRDLLEYDFKETECGGANESLVLIAPSSFMSPNMEPPASLSPVEAMLSMEAYQKKVHKNCSPSLLEGGELMNRCELHS